jgi:hypothetical protein
METELLSDTPERNPDLITKEPDLHPVGTGLGAAAGCVAGIGAVMATGIMFGSVVGPLGTAMGVAAGVVAGALVGKGVAEQMHLAVEETGSHKRYPDKSFDDAELVLEREWEQERGESRLPWEDAKPAARDAWDWVPADSIRACDAGGCCKRFDTGIDEEEEASEYAPSLFPLPSPFRPVE